MRPHRMILFAALALGLMTGALSAPTTAHGQAAPSVETEAPSAAAAPTGSAVAPASAAATASALPVREQAPRTLRAHWHVFTAFAIAWLLLFGYALALGRRFARIERSLEAVQGGSVSARRSDVASVG